MVEVCKNIVIIVPGPTDRTFYKALIMKTYSKQLEVIDLDSRDFKTEREKVIKTVLKQLNPKISKLAVLRLVKKDTNSPNCLNVIILPSEREVTYTAQTLIEYLLGSSEHSIDYVVIAEDAEEEDPEGKVESMLRGVTSNVRTKLEEIDRGRGYREVVIYSFGNTNIQLLIIIQGIFGKELEGLATHKHAIEDFIIYSHKNLVKELERKYPEILELIIKSKNAHKKLTLLLAIMRCFHNLEEFIFRDIDFERLVDDIETLRKLKTVIDKLCGVST